MITKINLKIIFSILILCLNVDARKLVHIGDLEGEWNQINYLAENKIGLEFCDSQDKHGIPILLDSKTTKWIKLVEENDVVFAGDITDKGDYGLTLLKFIVELKKKYPDRVTLLTGNRDINKLVFLTHLNDRAMKKLPVLSHQNQYKNLDKWREEYVDLETGFGINTKMGRFRFLLWGKLAGQNVIEHRKNELLRIHGLDSISEEASYESLMEDVSFRGPLIKYLKNSELIHFDKETKTLFAHGAINDENFFLVPQSLDRRRTLSYKKSKDLNSWINELNNFLKVEVGASLKSPHRESLLVAYHDIIPETFTNPKSVVYGRFSTDPCLNIELPSDEVIEKLKNSGVQRIVVGHTPMGGVPNLFRNSNSSDQFQVVVNDNTNVPPYLRRSAVILEGESITVIGTLLKDDGTTEEINFTLNKDENDDKIIGLPFASNQILSNSDKHSDLLEKTCEFSKTFFPFARLSDGSYCLSVCHGREHNFLRELVSAKLS